MGRVFNNATSFYEGLTSPPEAERVAWRMLAMLAACDRGYNDLAFKEDGRKPVNEPPPLPDWVIYLVPNLIKELQPEELVSLDTPLGMLSAHLISKLTWLCEGLAVLKWALGLIPKPKWDPVAPFKLLNLEIDPYTFPQEAKLRDEEEIRMYAEMLSTWQWRFIKYSFDGVKRMNFVEECKKLEFLYEDISIIEGDIMIAGDPIWESENVIRYDNYPRVADERLKAAKWLCGFPNPVL